MVLPPPVAHDASGPDIPVWLRRLIVILGLSRAGVLVLVDHAHPERLGELVRALLPTHPDLEVHREARKLAEVEPGSTLVLVPRAEDADWLNINRPLFAAHALRVVLFCPRETSVALARGAVDFFDWISHRLECPPGPAPFAVAGLRRALAVRAPGIVWRGGDLDEAFRAARPRRALRRVSAAQPYESMVAEVKASQGDWLAWTDVDGDFRLRRVRWALAEARCRTRAVLVEPAVSSPGWWEVHGHVTELGAARERLERVGARYPGRLAALMDLEPEAIELAGTLLERGFPERALEAELERGPEPGAAIGRLVAAHGLVSEKELVRGKASPPAMRAFSVDTAEVHRLQKAETEAVVQRLKREELLTAEDASWWAASTTVPLPVGISSEGLGRRGDGAEVQLRYEHATGEIWAQLASVALLAGDLSVAHIWAVRAEKLAPREWMSLAQVLLSQGKWSEAVVLLRQRLTVATAERGWIFHALADVLIRQGRYTEAEELLRQVLATNERALEMGHSNSAVSLHLLAQVLVRQGRYLEAEELLRQVLATNEKALGVGHLHVLAQVLERQGRYAEAEELLRQVLATNEKALGVGHPNYAASLYELAQVLVQQGRYTEAEELLRQGLATDEKALGVGHPNYTASLHLLARVLERQGRYTEAEELLRQVLATNEKVLGVGHPGYTVSLRELARVLERQGRYLEAEELLRQVLATSEKALGGAHPDYAVSLQVLAGILERQGRYAEAEELLRQVLAIEEKALGANHPELCAALTLLGSSLARQNRPIEAEAFLLRSLELALKTWGPRHPETAQALYQLAQVQFALKKTEAVATAQQAMDAFLHSLGPHHPTTVEALPELKRILGEGG